MKIYFISLGCPRNLVDTETMLGQLLQEGHTISEDPTGADCAVVNTCSFIQPAVEESIDAILEMAEWKKQAQGRKLIVAGCLPERYRENLAESLPEVDVFLGTGAFSRIGEALQGVLDKPRLTLPPPVPLATCAEPTGRFQTGLPHLAYLKIAEGCSGHCTYCIIPKLRGRQHSRPMDDIVTEAEFLVRRGIKELVLVAQNTTAYGHDLNEGYRLEDLLKRLAVISGLSWIRVLYGHPDYVTDQLIETIDTYNNISPYFDIPVQHISQSILKKMGRSHDSDHIRDVFQRIRSKIPKAALRTTLIVGFPGETDADVIRLLDFIEAVQFDHLGTFAYSDDKDLPSHRLKKHVPEPVKGERLERIMTLQASISRKKNQRYVGKTLRVLIDEVEKNEAIFATGRTIFQAPEIDGLVRVHGYVQRSSFVDVTITGGDEYDLTGTI